MAALAPFGPAGGASRAAERGRLRARAAASLLAVPLGCDQPPAVAGAPRPRAPGAGWQFRDGATLDELVIEPPRLEPGGALTVRWRAAERGACDATLELSPPRIQARREPYRGRAQAHPADPRVARVTVPFSRGHAELALDPWWRAQSAVVELTRRCAGRTIPVLRGPARRALVEGRPVARARAVVAVLEVSPDPPALPAPAELPAARLDGALDEWSADRFVRLADSLDGEPVAGVEGWAALGATEGALWLAVEVTAPSDAHRPTFEWFVAADGGEPYLELVVEPTGRARAIEWAARRRGDRPWPGEWRQALTRVDRTWRVEASIPAAALRWLAPAGPAGVQPTVRTNVFVTFAGAPAPALALVPTRAPDFHRTRAGVRSRFP